MIKLVDKPKNLTIQVISELQQLDDDTYYKVEITKQKDKRSVEQNKKMWAMIEQASKAMRQDKWTTYLNLLETSDIKGDYIQVQKHVTTEDLRKIFRAVVFIQEIDDVWNGYRVIVGSSKLSVEEMTELIDRAYDLLAELGIYEERWF